MNHTRLESADLFTPGRASYVTSRGDGSFKLNLTEASTKRSRVAADIFDNGRHTRGIFAGGFPGIAQNWPPEHTPKPGNREADLLSLPLIARLKKEGWSDNDIAEMVKCQGDSDNSIGDVLLSIEAGYLDPNDFHDSDEHGIELVTGGLHGIRFRNILATALDINPRRIQRVAMSDIYGTPAIEFRRAESAKVAMSKEFAAVALNQLVMHRVRPGNLSDLREAEERFRTIATRA